MSRTDLDAATLARSLRRMAGDGSMEWCCEPMQASVLLDVADMLDENAKLRELCGRALTVIENNCSACAYFYDCNIVNDCKCVAPKKIRDELRELGVEVTA